MMARNITEPGNKYKETEVGSPCGQIKMLTRYHCLEDYATGYGALQNPGS